jgi:apolipoprotein D and lipocalin family protein
MKKLIISILSAMFGIITFGGCETIPKGAVAVRPFEKEKYLGKWYEIARFDFYFERDLNNVTATYSLKPNGSIKVLNRGYNYKTMNWKEALGKAKPAGLADEGKLKVSFFGPFYSAYNIIALDKEYKYALVAGKNLDYLWILAREKSIPDNIRQEYLQIAQSIGFDTSTLIWTEHNEILPK